MLPSNIKKRGKKSGSWSRFRKMGMEWTILTCSRTKHSAFSASLWILRYAVAYFLQVWVFSTPWYPQAILTSRQKRPFVALKGCPSVDSFFQQLSVHQRKESNLRPCQRNNAWNSILVFWFCPRVCTFSAQPTGMRDFYPFIAEGQCKLCLTSVDCH